MHRDMHDKGYPFPLFTLDLCTPAMTLPEEARYSIALPGGRLVVRAGLRRRGACVSTAACEDAIARALAALALDGPALGRFGFDEAWRAALLHWRERMVAAQLDASERRSLASGGGAERRRLVEEGRRLWGRLSLCARLGQLTGLVTRGRAPEGAQGLLLALREAALRAEAHRERLAQHGFGAAERAALGAVIERLDASLRPAGAPAEEASAALQVLRGAILGDVALLCQAAREVLPAPQLQALQLRRALLLRG